MAAYAEDKHAPAGMADCEANAEGGSEYDQVDSAEGGNMHAEMREAHLAADQLSKKRRRSEETAQQHAARLQNLRSNQAQRLPTETEDQWQTRYNQVQHLAAETEAQWRTRRLSANQHLRLAA